MRKLVTKIALLVPFLFTPCLAAQDIPARKDVGELPKQYDLRKVGGLTPIKAQLGGTCWTHGTMAAIESNLLVAGTWKKLGGKGSPALSEYHLDWWNGFNQAHNTDLKDPAKDPSGLRIHNGGDYRVSAAYISRGDGVIVAPRLADNAIDRGWYSKKPDHKNPGYQRYYVRDIEWFVVGDNLENIDVIKRRVIQQGAIGTAYAVSKGFMSKDFVHYQPKTSTTPPNHAVAIAGWDDTKVSSDPDKKTPKPGAWLIKNSWGTKNAKTGKPQGESGFYWISYYDKVCCRDVEMGAVSFRNVEPMKYGHIYYHDFHGWRDTLKDVAKAFNVFKAIGDHTLGAVSFYTADDNARYTAKIYTRFENGKLEGLKATAQGEIAVKGFHTIDLQAPVQVKQGETFIVCLELSSGGQPIDRTSEIPVLLQPAKKETKQPDKKDTKQPAKRKPGFGPNGPIVISTASAGESFFFDGKEWRDLYTHRFTNPDWATFDRTANFCMKALAVDGK